MATEIEQLYVSLGMHSTLSQDMAAAEASVNKLEATTDAAAIKMEADFEKVGTAAKAMGKTLTLYVTTPLLAIGAASIYAAGNAAETQSKFEQVYGSLSSDVQDWAEEFGNAAGRSTTDLQDMLATMGSIVKAMGLTGESGAEFSETLTQLAIDMGSFNNVSDERAFSALRSAITGEYEALKGLGVVINQAKVEQELLNMGLEGGVKSATDAQIAQARLNLILRATEDAQGDAERTAGSFANQLKALQADAKEAAEMLGEDLLPAAQSLIGITRQMIQGYEQLDESTQSVIIVTAGFAAALGPALIVSGSLVSSIGKLRLAMDYYKASTFAATAATKGFSVALATTPAGLVALSVAGLVSGLAILTYTLGDTKDENEDFNESLEETIDYSKQTSRALRDLADESRATANEIRDAAEFLEDHYYNINTFAINAEADMKDMEATTLDAMAAAKDAVDAADDVYNGHSQTISNLTDEYKDLKAAIEDMPEDISDQERAIKSAGLSVESAELSVREAEARLKEVYSDKESTQLDIDRAELNLKQAYSRLDDAKDRVDDENKRLLDLQAEQEEALGGRTIPEAKAYMTELEKQIADEKILLDKSYKEKIALEEDYNEIRISLYGAGNQKIIDKWREIKQEIESNPITAKVSYEVAGMNFTSPDLEDFDYAKSISTTGQIDQSLANTAAIPGNVLSAIFGAIVDLIPGLATGGVVTKPTLAMIGEGGPEAIVPLNSSSSNSFGGDTIIIEKVNFGSVQDVAPGMDAIFKAIDNRTQANRIRKGIRA